MMDLKFNRYCCDLPQNIVHVMNIKEKDSTPDNSNKKRKSTDCASPMIVMNKDTDADWKLKADETWHMWRHKTGNGPSLLTGSKPCLKFHVCASEFTV